MPRRAAISAVGESAGPARRNLGGGARTGPADDLCEAHQIACPVGQGRDRRPDPGGEIRSEDEPPGVHWGTPAATLDRKHESAAGRLDVDVDLQRSAVGGRALGIGLREIDQTGRRATIRRHSPGWRRRSGAPCEERRSSVPPSAPPGARLVRPRHPGRRRPPCHLSWPPRRTRPAHSTDGRSTRSRPEHPRFRGFRRGGSPPESRSPPPGAR